MTELPAGGRLPPAALPAGSRDVLPVEAAELRAIEAALRGRFAAFGYREVMTPVLEFEDVVERAQEGALREAFRLFDETGRVLVLRPDLTIPVARLVATRMADHPGPVRVSYVARAFRPPRPGRPRRSELRQAGVELVGAAGPGADAEAVALLVDGLRAAGLADARVAVADVSLTAAVLDGLDVAAPDRAALGAALAARDFVQWRRRARAVRVRGADPGLLEELPTLRGGREALARVAEGAPVAAPACARLEAMLDLVGAHGAGDAVMVDLGIMRDWSYYSGIVMEAYAPGVGAPVAMGGRYDGLAARFGRARPAVGFAITLDLLHRALAAGTPAGAPVRRGVVLAGGLDREAAAAAALRRAGVPVVAAPADEPAGEELAAAEGWRFVARREGRGFAVLDRARGEWRACARLEEELPSLS